jgi:hypothetical protein
MLRIAKPSRDFCITEQILPQNLFEKGKYYVLT